MKQASHSKDRRRARLAPGASQPDECSLEMLDAKRLAPTATQPTLRSAESSSGSSWRVEEIPADGEDHREIRDEDDEVDGLHF